ncbi:hypothetical protein TBK1r_69530 [Stieleria magnilauensis]|uniref:Uncharacterized protein n=1 Tax=Stieleria magnilauensis TaxID=2527963 RepID=A0ABX5Y358_9BACT|nr:hypothetical protein TBK1r_69530 [Planctomycetes bacterium TBK1r]
MAVGQIEPHCDDVPGAAQPSQMLGLLAPGYGYACPLGKNDLCRYQRPGREGSSEGRVDCLSRMSSQHIDHRATTPRLPLHQIRRMVPYTDHVTFVAH